MATIPTDDTFDYGNSGSDPYGTYLLGYLGWAPKVAVDAGSLVTSSSVGAGRAWCIGEESVATNGNIPCAFMRRQAFAANVSVRSSFKFIARAGTATTDHGYELGVFARAIGGALADDTTEFVRYDDGDAYAALLERTGTNTYDLKLVLWIGGAEVLLTSRSLNILPPTLVAKALKVRLDVETNTSGNVDLAVWVKNLKAYDVSPSTPSSGVPLLVPGNQIGIIDIGDVWHQLLTHTDSSGSKITSGGRCGILLEREREYDSGSTRIVTAVNSFRVHTIGDVVLFGDGFRRAAPNLSRSFTDAWAVTALSIASDFTNDLFSGEQITSQLVQRDTASEEVTQFNVADLGFALDFNPADSDYLSVNLGSSDYVSNIVGRSLTLFTWTAFANIDTNDTGNIFFDDFLDLGNGTSLGMTLGLKPGGAANTYRMFATVSSESSGSGTTYETADITEVGMLGVTTHFAWTISAVNDRVRFYVDGALAVERAMTENPQLRGSFTTRVGWNGTAGATSANFLEGRLDELRLYWLELTANELLHLAAVSGVGIDIDRSQLLFRWPLDEFGASIDFGEPGDYLGDTFGATLVSLPATFAGATPVPAVTGIANAVQPRVLCATQRQVDSQVEQHRGATIEFLDINQTAGIFVRAGFTSSTDFTGYRVDVRPDPGGYVRMYRVRSGTDTLIASVAATVALSTPYDVRLQVSGSDTGDPTSAALLAVYIDDVQAVLVAEGNMNVSGDANGTIRDRNDFRILGGNLEGFHMLTPGGTAAIDVDTWKQGPLDTLIFALTGPTIQFSTETSGVTGSLDILFPDASERPTFPHNRTQAGHIRSTFYESGHALRITRSLASRREFRERRMVSVAQLAAFRTFFDEHLAREIPFTYTPDGELIGVFAFADDSFSSEPVTADTWEIAFNLIERLDPRAVPAPLSSPADIASPSFWCSAQANVYDAWQVAPIVDLTTQSASEKSNLKTPAVLNGDVERIHDARLALPQIPTGGLLGRMMNNVFFAAPPPPGSNPPPYALIEFASTGVINGKRTLESRAEDAFYLAEKNSGKTPAPLWTDAGFTFMAHIVPPTAGYGANEHIFSVGDTIPNEMMRIGWTTSQFYLNGEQGSPNANRAITGYDLGGSTDAKTICVRWVKGSKVELYDGGSTPSITPASLVSMPLVAPQDSVVFVSSSTESTAIQSDAGIGTKLFVQELSIWPRALSNDELNSVANFWAAQYGSTWTDI